MQCQKVCSAAAERTARVLLEVKSAASLQRKQTGCVTVLPALTYKGQDNPGEAADYVGEGEHNVVEVAHHWGPHGCLQHPNYHVGDGSARH